MNTDLVRSFEKRRMVPVSEDNGHQDADILVEGASWNPGTELQSNNENAGPQTQESHHQNAIVAFDADIGEKEGPSDASAFERIQSPPSVWQRICHARNRIQFIGSSLRRHKTCQVIFLLMVVASAGLAWWSQHASLWGGEANIALYGWNKNDLRRLSWSTDEKDKLVWELAAIRERLMVSAQPKPMPATEKIRGVAIIFATYAGMALPRLWEWWLQDAYDWIHEQKLEDASVPPEQSKILRPFVHYFWGFDHDYIADCAPPHLKEATMKEVGRGLYRNLWLNYELMFSTAFDECPECYFFVTMSHNSIPLKRFKDWYTDLLNDARSRITFFTTVFNAAFPGPKTSAWKTLIRPHMEVLARNQIVTGTEEEKALQYATNHFTEEYWSLYQLSQYIGESCLKEIRAAYLDEGNIHHYPICSQAACPFPEEQFECWHQPCHGDFLSENRAYPWAYSTIDESWLRQLMGDRYSFFARKFSMNTLVRNSSGEAVPVEEYIKQILELKSTWRPRDDCEVPGSFRDLGDYTTIPDMEKVLRATCLPGLKPEYRNTSCTATGMAMGPGWKK